jgi:hypothetical protein
MTTPALRPGDVVWRIHYPDSGKAPSARRCVFVRPVNVEFVSVRASTFSRDFVITSAEHIFPDRDSCRAEIQRRAAMEAEP